MRRPRRRSIETLTTAELRLMRQAGLVVARALKAMTATVRAGMTTREVDAIAVEILAQHQARSNFLGYEPGYGVAPYPAVTCVSVNDEVVHGIPGERVLMAGDLVSIDFGAIIGGCHGDAARSVIVGPDQTGPAGQAVAALNQAVEAALWAGIGAARLGGRIAEISAAIETSIKGAGPYGIVRDFTGHGIGHRMHQEPDIPNYRVGGRSPVIEPGMCFAIEPIATLGGHQVNVLDDDWTVVTADSSVSCHWENTITVTQHGLWVLTEEDGGEAALGRLGLPFGPLAD